MFPLNKMFHHCGKSCLVAILMMTGKIAAWNLYGEITSE